MGATNSFESEVLRHIFLNEDIANIGDAGGLLQSIVDGNLYVALFTISPGEAGEITNEAVYTGYARIAVARGGAGWVEDEGSIHNAAVIIFPECAGASETITHFGICKSLAGDDMIIHGALPAPALIFAGIQPQYGVNGLVINLD